MNNQELEILKDKYAMGTLTEAEYASLEVEILQNADLESELKMHKNLVRGVEYAGELEMKEMLEKIHYQSSGSSTSSDPKAAKSNNMLYVIAGLLILAALLAYFFLGNGNKEEVSPTRIYAEFYSPYQPSLQDRGENLDDALKKFNAAYSELQYETALTTIKPYLESSKNDIKLTAAIAAIETNDIVLAEQLLNEVIESKDFYFMDHAIWYKALIKLKNNDINATKEILTPLIENPKADHHHEAKDLIAKIKG